MVFLEDDYATVVDIQIISWFGPTPVTTVYEKHLQFLTLGEYACDASVNEDSETVCRNFLAEREGRDANVRQVGKAIKSGPIVPRWVLDYEMCNATEERGCKIRVARIEKVV